MSRHRDIRNMDFQDDYDGYDDVYGHSVDDDYYISPSNKQFIYNRDNSRDKNIQEEDEKEAELSDMDKAKLESCITQITEMLGSTLIPRNELVNVIMKFNYNTERSLNALLEQQNKEPERIEQDVGNTKCLIPSLKGVKITPQSKFTIPKPNFNKSSITPKFNIPKPNYSKNLQENLSPESKPRFNIPKPNFNQENMSPKNTFVIPKLGFKLDPSKIESDSKNTTNLKNNSLSEYTRNHFKTLETSIDNKASNITQGVSQIKLEDNTSKVLETKLLTNIQNVEKESIKNDWHIDLSMALKQVSSLPSLNKKKENKQPEKFEIEFISCDEEVLYKKTVKRKPLTCTMNLSHVLNNTFNNSKETSRLGKALCRKYKQICPLIFKIDIVASKFDFRTPSPDDIVQKNINLSRLNNKVKN